MARDIFKGLDRLVEGYHTEEGRRKPKKQIKEAKTRTEIRLGDKVYPIKDKEFLKGKVAGYGNEHGLEHIRTIKYSDGTSYKIYDSGFGNFEHADACAVLIEKLKGDVPPKGYEKPTSVKGDWIWDEVRYDWYDRDTGSYYAEVKDTISEGVNEENNSNLTPYWAIIKNRSFFDEFDSEKKALDYLDILVEENPNDSFRLFKIKRDDDGNIIGKREEIILIDSSAEDLWPETHTMSQEETADAFGKDVYDVATKKMVKFSALEEALYGKKEIDEFFLLCDKLGLKTFGDLKDFSDNNKNRILVNDLLKDYDSSMPADAFFQTLRDRVAEEDEFEYDDPLNVIKNKDKKNESLDDKNTKNSIEVEVKSGINGDGFKVIVKDTDGSIIEQDDFSYGYNASYNKSWADKDKPFVTDIINNYLSKYNLNKDDLILTKGKNTFKDTDVSDETITRFKTNYLSESRSALTEDHKVQNYKGFELDWDNDEIDDEEGIATFNVHIRLDGKDLHIAHGFRQAREWVDKNYNTLMGPIVKKWVDEKEKEIEEVSDGVFEPYEAGHSDNYLIFDNAWYIIKKNTEEDRISINQEALNRLVDKNAISKDDEFYIQYNYINHSYDEEHCSVSDVYGNKLLERLKKLLGKSNENLLDDIDYIWFYIMVKSPFDKSINIYDILDENLNSSKKASKQLTEGHEQYDYKGFSIDLDDDQFHSIKRHGSGNIVVEIKIGDTVYATVNGYDAAEEWIDKNGKAILDEIAAKNKKEEERNVLINDCVKRVQGSATGEQYANFYAKHGEAAVNVSLSREDILKAAKIGSGGVYQNTGKGISIPLSMVNGFELYLNWDISISSDPYLGVGLYINAINENEMYKLLGDPALVGWYNIHFIPESLKEVKEFWNTEILSRADEIAHEIVENSWRNSKYNNYDGIYEALVQEDSIKIKDLSSVKEIQKDDEQTWADKEYSALMKKGKPNWNESDWETYHYIQQLRFDSGYYSESLKEEYDPYEDNEIIRAIGDQIADGNDYGSTYDRDWELKIYADGGEVVENENISSDFYSRLLVDISYPVLDGHLNYYGLNIILWGVPATKEELEFLGFTDEDIERYLKAEDFEEEIETWIDYEITYDGPDIEDEFDSDEDFDDDILDESKKSSVLSKDIVEEVRSEILRGLDIPDDWFSHPDYLVDDGSGYEFYTVRVIDGDLARQIELFINSNYEGVSIVAFDAETNELLDTYEGSQELNVSVFVNNNEFKDLDT